MPKEKAGKGREKGSGAICFGFYLVFSTYFVENNH